MQFFRVSVGGALEGWWGGEAGGGALCGAKVHPSPGAARGVWALPQPAACGCVADSDALSCSDSSDLLTAHTSELIFDAVKSGLIDLALTIKY